MFDVTTEVGKLGILGPLFVALGLYTLKLHGNLRTSESDRVNDQMKMLEKFAAMVERQTEIRKEQSAQLEAQGRLLEGLIRRLEETERTMYNLSQYVLQAVPTRMPMKSYSEIDVGSPASLPEVPKDGDDRHE